MTIGAFCRATGITEDTARYYERLGMLTPVRGPNNYRVYGPSDLERMRFIETTRGSGFSLKEVREFLGLHASGRHACDDSADLARRKLDELEERIRALQKTRDRLQAALASCPPGSDPCRFAPASG